jgi:cytochrome c
MSKQRYQPFDGLHIGLAKPLETGGAALAFSSRGAAANFTTGAREMKSIFAAAMLVAATVQVAHAQDVAAGEQSFKKCLPCHSVGEDAKNKVGPALNGLDGRHSGSVPDYSYSESNKNSGITWSEATFKDYIKDPRAKIPNTKMIFPGIKNEKEAGDLWAYLKQFDAGGKKK